MLALFSSGIVDAPPTPAFALAVLAGVNAWVLAATVLKLPVSTTHVSTGAIAGTAGSQPSRLNLPALREFLVAWTVTPLAAGLVSAAVPLPQ